MSTQIICDECGQPVKVDEDHYQLTGSKVKEVDGALTVVDAAVTLHYHVEHLPVYKVGGEPIEGLTPPPEPEPTPEPEPEPVIEPMPPPVIEPFPDEPATEVQS